MPNRRSHPPSAQRAEGLRGAIWLWPTLAGVAAAATGTVLATMDAPRGLWRQLTWPGDTDSASALIQVVAGSVITVTTLTFSLTVLALQLASQQFSPRLLRQFTRDPVTRAVLAVLVGTFVLALTVLRHLRADTPVPHLALLGVTLSGVASLAALLGFITHIVRLIRVDTMMATAHGEAQAAIEAFYPLYGDEEVRQPGPDVTPTGRGHVVLASRSGFLRTIDVQAMVEGAETQDVVVQMMARPGDHVVMGTPVAVAWSSDGGPPRDTDAADRMVHDTVQFGYERTVEQDAAFGFRQLEDIAVKALSPAINDPVTAVHSIGYLADLLVRLLGCRLGPTVHEDRHGTARAIVPDRDLAYYVDLSCAQVRRYGRHEPTVLVALLRMLRDAAVSARDDEHRRVIGAEVERILASADEGLLDDDLATVTDLAERVHAALAGNLLDAYSDRSGETRSV